MQSVEQQTERPSFQPRHPLVSCPPLQEQHIYFQLVAVVAPILSPAALSFLCLLMCFLLSFLNFVSPKSDTTLRHTRERQLILNWHLTSQAPRCCIILYGHISQPLHNSVLPDPVLERSLMPCAAIMGREVQHALRKTLRFCVSARHSCSYQWCYAILHAALCSNAVPHVACGAHVAVLFGIACRTCMHVMLQTRCRWRSATDVWMSISL